MEAYQFIKYDKDTTSSQIEKVGDTGAVICFDFEDGIVNPVAPEETAKLKEASRTAFLELYSLSRNNDNEMKIGVRVNNVKSSDFIKDIHTIRNKTFDCIFVPKIEKSEEIDTITNHLKANKIDYQSIIPIIESKKGFENLAEILHHDKSIRKIAFGHCDYNLDVKAYPFFHQDSWEYWKWITSITDVAKRFDVQLINSPYLNIGNETFFCEMLDYLASKRELFCGQITLSSQQSRLCYKHEPSSGRFHRLLDNKNLISAKEETAANTVAEFEQNNKRKGLSRCGEMIISYQEYIASREVLSNKNTFKEICFVGGCFPVQYDIVYENLFHQRLRRMLEENSNYKVNINIIRYECFKSLLDKLKALLDLKKIDILIFSIRSEPYLRILKLIYKYLDKEGKKRVSFNLPYFKELKSEEYDYLDLRCTERSKKESGILHKLLITSNYLGGCLVGNRHYALRKYYRITLDIIELCESRGLRCLILGANLRSNAPLEATLSKDLDRYFRKRVDVQRYIIGYEKDGNKKMIKDNGIHVTEAYHELIARKIFERLR